MERMMSIGLLGHVRRSGAYPLGTRHPGVKGIAQAYEREIG